MDKFTFSYPTKVYFGEGSAAQAFAAELDKVGKTVMLAFGGESIKKNGIYDEMKELLTQAGKKVVDFSGIMPNPTYAKVQEGATLARENKVDFILAVGGGSGFAGTIETIAELQPNASVISSGLSISRDSVSEAESDVVDWVKGLNLTAE